MEFRIKEARKMAKMTQKELAARLGISISTLSEYESGKYDPRSDILCEIADICGVSVDFLLCRSTEKTKPAPLSEQAMKMAHAYNELDPHGKRIIDSVLDEETRRMAEEKAAKEKAAKAPQEMETAQEITPVRYIRHYLVPSAAGFASPVEGEDYEMIEAGPDVPPNADFCIEISGKSMEPYIKDGERVYVQRDVNVREFEDAGIWYYAGDVLCKQYCIDFSGALYLLSANRKFRDADKRIPREELVNVVCYGRVILPFKLPKPEP